MLKKLGFVFIVLMIFIAAMTAVYAGNDDVAGENSAPATKVSPVNSTAPVSNAAQKNNAATADQNTAPESTDLGETKTGTVSAETGIADGTANAEKADNTENETDPETEFRLAIRKVLEEGVPVDNGQFIMTINVPDNIEEQVSIYGTELDFSGETEYTDIEILIARLNSETGMYQIIELPDGDDMIAAGSGVFSKVIELEYGENNLLIISYRSSEKDATRIQYNSISVMALKEEGRQAAVRNDWSIIDFFSRVFK